LLGETLCETKNYYMPRNYIRIGTVFMKSPTLNSI
jgi:hypothetical protein